MFPRLGIVSVLALAAGLGLARPAADRQSLLYVDDDAPEGGDGASWATAYSDLQHALSAAADSGGAVTEIRVAQGIYTPDGGTGDREATFQLLNGLALRGGYAGLTGADPDERDIAAYETILSGDLAGDDGPGFQDYEENSYHVVTGSGTGQTAVMEGFTVAAGNADGWNPATRSFARFRARL